MLGGGCDVLASFLVINGWEGKEVMWQAAPRLSPNMLGEGWEGVEELIVMI